VFRHDVIERLDKTDASVSQLIAATHTDLAIVKNDIEGVKGDIKDQRHSLAKRRKNHCFIPSTANR
jgi:hypothetical protein